MANDKLNFEWTQKHMNEIKFPEISCLGLTLVKKNKSNTSELFSFQATSSS